MGRAREGIGYSLSRLIISKMRTFPEAPGVRLRASQGMSGLRYIDILR